MTDQIVESAPPRLMNEAEQTLARAIYQAVQWHSTKSERSMQSAEFKAGISDLGFCSERLRRMLMQMQPEDAVDMLPAAWGTALGAYVEEAVLLHGTAAWIAQPKVTVVLTGDGGTYRVTGHPDLVDAAGLVVDIKTSRGLSGPERVGPSQQQQFQRHCYAAGAHAEGLFGDLPLEDVQVANVWFDRAGDDRRAYCHMEPFSHDMVQAATWWLDDVVYAFKNHQEARKEPPREVCFKVCGFARDCRGADIGDEQGLITDPGLLGAIHTYADGLALERAGRRLKDQAKVELDGVSGSTGEYAVSWTHVNGAHVAYDRDPYDRLNLRQIK
jgi:hypothetical protein